MSDEWPGRRPVMPTNLCAPACVSTRASRPCLAAATLGVLAALIPVQIALGQQTAQINVAPTIIAAPATQIPLTVQIGPPQAVPANSFVRMRGLPPSVSLTEGYAIAPGSWAVPLFALSNLKANIPAGASGRTDFVIVLLGADGTQIAEARSALVIGTPAMAPPAEKAPADPRLVSPPSPVAATRQQVAPRAAELPPQEKARADRLLAKGEEYFASGNIAGSAGLLRARGGCGSRCGSAQARGHLRPGRAAAHRGERHRPRPQPRAEMVRARARDGCVGSRGAAGQAQRQLMSNRRLLRFRSIGPVSQQLAVRR